MCMKKFMTNQTDFVLMMLIESHGSGSIITQVYTALGCKKNVAHPVNIYKHYAHISYTFW